MNETKDLHVIESLRDYMKWYLKEEDEETVRKTYESCSKKLEDFTPEDRATTRFIPLRFHPGVRYFRTSECGDPYVLSVQIHLAQIIASQDSIAIHMIHHAFAEVTTRLLQPTHESIMSQFT